MRKDKLTIANDGNTLALVIIGPIPSRGVHEFALVILDARDIGIFGQIQLADGGDQKVGSHGIAFLKFGVLSTGNLDGGLPALFGIVPVRLLDLGVETDVSVQVVFLGDSDEVALLKTRLSARVVLIEVSTRTRSSSWPGYNLDQSGFCSKLKLYRWEKTGRISWCRQLTI